MNDQLDLFDQPENEVSDEIKEPKLIHADCLDAMRDLPDACVDAIVTDPPAGIAFMSREWDKDKGGRDAWVAWMTDVARECLRVIKPGGHALVWTIPRTSHWTGWAWEGAGWEPRDKIVHLFGSGFPKSLNVSKSIDKSHGAEQEVIGIDHEWIRRAGLSHGGNTYTTNTFGSASGPNAGKITTPATDAAKKWDGWGTALKPASEDWWLFRKPLVGTVAANVLAHGTGAINVDACRIGDFQNVTPSGVDRRSAKLHELGYRPGEYPTGAESKTPGTPPGRWPANVALDEEAAAMLDEQSGTTKSTGGAGDKSRGGMGKLVFGKYALDRNGANAGGLGDSGGASRFFYTAKASRKERGEGNVHPTVKPLALMRWLVRLVTPPGGTVLDPFAGSGTTLLAARAEGFGAVGIEREAEYVEIMRKRLEEK